MQGKKLYTEKLFTSFQLSDRVPADNFYRLLKEAPDLQWLPTATRNVEAAVTALRLATKALKTLEKRLKREFIVRHPSHIVYNTVPTKKPSVIISWYTAC